MINVRADLYGIEETITRPILISITNDIKKVLGISKEIYTQYDDKDQIGKKKNKLGEIQGDNTMRDDIVYIEYEEDSEDTKETSLIPIRPDFFPIFKDTDINVSIMPIYHSRQLVVKFKYATKSKSKAHAYTNKLRLLTANEGFYRRHRLEYYINIPNYIDQLLLHLYTLKNNRISINEQLEFTDYLKNCMDVRADFTHTLDADPSKSELVVREAQIDVPGYIIDDIYNLKPEYEEDFGYWTFEFNYGMIYEKPITLLAQYPVLIYNQIIDKQFRSFIEDGWREKPNINKPMTDRTKDAIELLERDSIFSLRHNNKYLTLPEFDNEIILPTETYLSRMFSVLIIVDESDPTLIFNIQDIPKISFKESVLKYIINQDRKYVTKRLQSMFYIELYKDSKKHYKNELYLTETGELRSTEPLDLKFTYRVMFNIVNDLNMLEKEARLRMKQFIREHIEIENSLPLRKPNYHQSITYDPMHYNTRKFSSYMEQDNIVTAYLSLLNITDNHIANVMNSIDNFYDIPFKVTDTGGRIIPKTIAQTNVLSLQAMMLEK